MSIYWGHGPVRGPTGFQMAFGLVGGSSTRGVTPVLDTTVTRHSDGDACWRWTLSNQIGSVLKTMPWHPGTVDLREHAVRLYFRFDPLPASMCDILTWDARGGIIQYPDFGYPDDRGHIRWNPAPGCLQLRIADGNGETVVNGPTIQGGQWYRLDLLTRMDLANGRTEAEWAIDGVAQPSVSRATTFLQQAFSMLVFGTPSYPATTNLRMQDFAAGSEATDYPIGPGRVFPLELVSNGVHSAPSSFQEDDGSGIDANSWDKLRDSVLATETDWLAQVSVGPFPTVQGRASSVNNTAATSHPVTLPAGIQAGELLLIFFSESAGTGATVNAPAGWTKLVESNNGANNGLAVLYRFADGSEGTSVTVTTSGSTKSSHLSYRISGASSPVTSTPATGASTAPNPPQLIPSDGKLPYLWFAVAGWDGTPTATAYPTNYTNGQQTGTSGGQATTNCGVAAAERQLTADSEDPGAFTLSASDDWVAFTIAVPPNVRPYLEFVFENFTQQVPGIQALVLHVGYEASTSIGGYQEFAFFTSGQEAYLRNNLLAGQRSPNRVYVSVSPTGGQVHHMQFLVTPSDTVKAGWGNWTVADLQGCRVRFGWARTLDAILRVHRLHCEVVVGEAAADAYWEEMGFGEKW